jgi:hypothetical protein
MVLLFSKKGVDKIHTVIQISTQAEVLDLYLFDGRPPRHYELDKAAKVGSQLVRNDGQAAARLSLAGRHRLGLPQGVDVCILAQPSLEC